MNQSRARAIVAVAPLIILVAGCDKIPLLAPTDSTITLSAGQRVLGLNSSTEITAVVQEQGGNPVQNGTVVRFTTSLGRVDPPESTTRNGVAVATFFSGDTSGQAEVRASSGAASGGTGTTPSNAITFTVGAAAADSVAVRVSPSTVTVNGGTVEVVATVLATNGRTLAGVPVSFTTTAGSLSSANAPTDGNGEARVQLTTNANATVRATTNGKTGEATVTVLGTPSVTLTCAGTGAAGATCTQLVGQAVVFTAARGTATTPLVETTLEFGDGKPPVSLGNLTSTSTITNVYSGAGSYTAVLRARDANGQTTSASVAVSITQQPPLSITLAATVGTATTTGQPVTFTATVTPTADAALVEVYEWDFGDGTKAETQGNSITKVYDNRSNPAPNPTNPQTYAATVRARTRDGRTASARTEFQLRLLPPTP